MSHVKLTRNIQFGILAAYLGCLLFGLTELLKSKEDIPHYFGDFLDQVIETYAPPIAIILGFFFTKRESKARARPRAKSHLLWVAATAVTIYLIVLSVPIFRFAFLHSKAPEEIEAMASIRPKISFLTAGLLAYFF